MQQIAPACGDLGSPVSVPSGPVECHSLCCRAALRRPSVSPCRDAYLREAQIRARRQRMQSPRHGLGRPTAV